MTFVCFFSVVVVGIVLFLCIQSLPSIQTQAKDSANQDIVAFERNDPRNILGIKAVFTTKVYYCDDDALTEAVKKKLIGFAKEMTFSNITYEKVSKEDLIKLWERLDEYASFLHLDTKAANFDNDWDPYSLIWYIADWFDYSDLIGF